MWPTAPIAGMHWNGCAPMPSEAARWAGAACVSAFRTVFEKGVGLMARTLAPYYRTAEAWLGVVEGRLHEQQRRAAHRLGRPIMRCAARAAREGGSQAMRAGARAARVKHVACAIACNGGRAVAARARSRREDH